VSFLDQHDLGQVGTLLAMWHVLINYAAAEAIDKIKSNGLSIMYARRKPVDVG